MQKCLSYAHSTMLCYAYGKGMIIGCVTTFEVHMYKMKYSKQKDSRER
jgi:hypothetical protein